MKKLAFLVGIALAILVSVNIAWAVQNYSDGIAVPYLKVGSQGTGGVTFFNGTIINETTSTDGADNPVTFGDNVRIDGRVWRGATSGPGDDMPFIVNDDLEVEGTLTAATIKELINGEVEGAGGVSVAALEETTWKGYSHYQIGETQQEYHKSEEVTVTFTPETETTGTWTSTPFNPFNPAISTADTDGDYTLVENVIFPGYDDGESHLVSVSIVDLKGNTMTLYNTSSTPGTITVLTKQ